jgi:hypothetical protein
MNNTEDNPDVSRYPIDPDRGHKKQTWVRDMVLGGNPLRLVAVEVTNRVGDLERTIRYELEGGEPVEVWQVGHEVHIIPKSAAEAGEFPWRE